MNTLPEISLSDSRIRRLTSLLSKVCWVSFVVILLIGLAGSIFSMSFARTGGTGTKLLIGSVILPFVYWAALIFLMRRFFLACSSEGAFTRKGISTLFLLAMVILVVASLKLVLVVAGAVFVSSSHPVVWTSLVQQVAPTLTSVLLGGFLFLMAKILEIACVVKEEHDLTV